MALSGSQHLPANRKGHLHRWAGSRNRPRGLRLASTVPSTSNRQRQSSHYGAALDLVTGKPFTYANAARNSYGWVDFEHYATTWEQRVAG